MGMGWVARGSEEIEAPHGIWTKSRNGCDWHHRLGLPGTFQKLPSTIFNVYNNFPSSSKLRSPSCLFLFWVFCSLRRKKCTFHRSHHCDIWYILNLSISLHQVSGCLHHYKGKYKGKKLNRPWMVCPSWPSPINPLLLTIGPLPVPMDFLMLHISQSWAMQYGLSCLASVPLPPNCNHCQHARHSVWWGCR